MSSGSAQGGCGARRLAARWLLLALVAGPACAAPPDVPTPENVLSDLGARVFADTVIAQSSSSSDLVTCTETLPACGAPTQDCASNPALGPPDGQGFSLGQGGRLEVAFRCNAVLERGSPDGSFSNDLKIWATVEPGAQGVVEVSYDGSSYARLNFLTQPDQELDLQRIPVSVIRFVRIVDGGQGGIVVDAVEAL